MIPWMLLLTLQEPGIASQYPSDEGIRHEPRVVFAETFETGDVRSIRARWVDVARSQNLALPDHVPPDVSGRPARGSSK